jgi:hypothetical protein
VAEGGWTERMESFADIRVLCSDCYELVRELNWIEDKDAFDSLLSESVAYLELAQSRVEKAFSLGQWERYDWAQERGELIFSHRGRIRVVADVQFVGTLSTRANTWMWAWANQSLLENIKAGARAVRAYGEKHSFHKLAAAHWRAEEEDGWEMTSVAAALLKAKGAYRTPDERGFTFMVITDIRWVQ